MPKKRKHPADKPRPGYEWSLEDDLKARDNSDWALPKPEKTKPKKRKPVVKKKPVAAKPKPASGDAGRKSPNLAKAKARSIAIRKSRLETRRRDIIQAEKAKRKAAGREAGRKIAVAKELVRIAKNQPRIKGKKIAFGRTAGRLNAEALVTIGKNARVMIPSSYVQSGSNRSTLKNKGIHVIEDVAAAKYDSMPSKKVRGAKPLRGEIVSQRARMVSSRSKPLAGIIPVVATLATGWLSGELKKKGKK